MERGVFSVDDIPENMIKFFLTLKGNRVTALIDLMRGTVNDVDGLEGILLPLGYHLDIFSIL